MSSAVAYEKPISAIVCPRVAKPGSNATYPYPPLNFIAANQPALLKTKTRTLLEQKIGGTNFFIVASPVTNRGVGFTLTIMFFMPEDDLFGDIVNGRNVSIGIACAILVSAVIIIFVLIFFLLRPLNAILSKMSDATQLKIGDEDLTS